MGNRANRANKKKRSKASICNRRRIIALAAHRSLEAVKEEEADDYYSEVELKEFNKNVSAVHVDHLEAVKEEKDDYDPVAEAKKFKKYVSAVHIDHTYSATEYYGKIEEPLQMSNENVPVQASVQIEAEPKTFADGRKSKRILMKKLNRTEIDEGPKNCANVNKFKRTRKKKVCMTRYANSQRKRSSVKQKYVKINQEKDPYLVERKDKSNYYNEMPRNDRATEMSEAPELQKFFEALTNNRPMKYCVVCLRTENERRLTKNEAFNKFTSAAKIENYWRNQLICYMCERQAQNALKFLKAAAFASAIHKIFGYYLNQDPGRTARQLFKKTNFRRILMKLGLGSGELLPGEWETSLMVTRDRSQLNETEPLVIDNQGVKLQNTLVPNEIYVIPDDPPSLHGQVTGTATRSNRGRQSGRYTQSDAAGNQSDGNVQQSNHVRTTTDSMELRSSEPKVSETLVIMDDEDPLQIQIAKVESEATGQTIHRSCLQNSILPDLPTNHIPPQPNLRSCLENSILPDLPTNRFPPQPNPRSCLENSILPDLQTNRILPLPNLIPPSSNVPKLVPIEQLLEKPNSIIPEDSVLITRMPDSNFILHPIVFNAGTLTVPTLAAKIVDGHLVLHSDGTTPTQANEMLTDLIHHPGKMISLPTNNVLTQNNLPNRITFEEPNMANDIQQATKRDGGPNQFAPQSKKSKGMPSIQSVNSEADKNDRIDWEDKIPMDVISFMDAVDPHRPMLPPNIKVPNTGPRDPTPRAICQSGVIIDLC